LAATFAILSVTSLTRSNPSFRILDFVVRRDTATSL
jgi:hypothetical protein